MFKVYRDGNKFSLKSKSKVINNLNIFTLQAVMRELGVSKEEIETGLDEMFKRDDNVIDYGINKCWTFTDKVAS